jgi:glutaconyl-CoA/methylmalonyl-CoA decarboxylase subunit gamma
MKKYIFNVDNQDYNIEILSIENGYAQVNVNNEVINIQIKQGEPVSSPAVVSAPIAQAPAISAPEVAVPAQESKPAPVANGKVTATLVAPLPGILIGIKVKVGDRVKVNQDIVVLEAMKMENNITSECDGVVLAINYTIGEAILQGDVMVEFGD